MSEITWEATRADSELDSEVFLGGGVTSISCHFSNSTWSHAVVTFLGADVVFNNFDPIFNKIVKTT